MKVRMKVRMKVTVRVSVSSTGWPLVLPDAHPVSTSEYLMVSVDVIILYRRQSSNEEGERVQIVH